MEPKDSTNNEAFKGFTNSACPFYPCHPGVEHERQHRTVARVGAIPVVELGVDHEDIMPINAGVSGVGALYLQGDEWKVSIGCWRNRAWRT